jgi:hypothetical protein
MSAERWFTSQDVERWVEAYFDLAHRKQVTCTLGTYLCQQMSAVMWRKRPATHRKPREAVCAESSES